MTHYPDGAIFELGLKFPGCEPMRWIAKSWTPRETGAVFFERLRCRTHRDDDHRQEHTGSDPGSQCLRSWLDQDSRGCRSERLDRFRIRPKESSFRPQLAFVATGDGPPPSRPPRQDHPPKPLSIALYRGSSTHACVRERRMRPVRVLRAGWVGSLSPHPRKRERPLAAGINRPCAGKPPLAPRLPAHSG